MEPLFTTHPSEDGLRVVDPVERTYEDLFADRPVDPSPSSTDGFHFPVDVAAHVRTDVLRSPHVVDVWIRTTDGDLVADTSAQESVSVPAGSYNVELSLAGVKLYLAVESPVEVSYPDHRTEIAFGGGARVAVGARSYHDRPAATVTVGRDPVEVMDALSLFGSALKTTSPERSFPTLRGHPPRIEVGDGFDAPDDLEAPETGVRIEVPADLSTVYPVAPLSYYLGAAVEPGDEPRLVADGRAFALDGPAGFEGAVARALKRTFLLDCVARTEGYYDVDLHERRQVEAALDRDLDFAALYDRPLAERVATYLDLPYDAVADAVPRWRVTADVEPEPDNAATLPFVADRLAVVRCDTSAPSAPVTVDSQPDELTDFYRGPAAGTVGEGGDAGGMLRSSDDAPSGPKKSPAASLDVVTPRPTDSLEHVWVADGVPRGATKATLAGFENRLAHFPGTEPGIDVTVVCNDPAMGEEGAVRDVYGDRDHVEVDVRVVRDATRADLRETLTGQTDFLHYIGHADEDGLHCTDGSLDVRDLDSVGVQAFLLNGCRSYEQGRALVERGSIGGFVTLALVSNRVATEIGLTVARVLNAGHSLASAGNLVGEEYVSESQYVIVGDGTAQLLGPPDGTPSVFEIEQIGQDQWELEVLAHPSNLHGIGSLYSFVIGNIEGQYLNSGRVGPFVTSTDDLADFLRHDSNPIRFEGELDWSRDMLRNVLLEG